MWLNSIVLLVVFYNNKIRVKLWLLFVNKVLNFILIVKKNILIKDITHFINFINDYGSDCFNVGY